MFQYKSNLLHVEDLSIDSLAEKVGTPFYCYSDGALKQSAGSFLNAFKAFRQKPLVCFAVKSNYNPTILNRLAEHGLGADVVSGGELQMALQCGIAANKIVFSGVGKSAAELKQALEANIFQINVESIPELEILNQVAGDLNCKASIAIRVNPDIDAETHAKISTGRAENKFGIAWEDAEKTFQMAQNMPNIVPMAIAVHIGSQITRLQPFEAAFVKVVKLYEKLQAQGIPLKRLDLGGGIGIRYMNENPTAIQDYATMVLHLTSKLDCQLIFEPGRFIAGNAGILVSKVLYIKESNGQKFAIIDAGMNDLMRPALYDATHKILPTKDGEATEQYHIVGPVCESSDVFARNIYAPPLNSGDLIAILSAGAYGSVMANNYNIRLSVPEILVERSTYKTIKRRQTFDDFMQLYS